MSKYVLPLEAFMQLSDIELALIRIEQEGDEHSSAIAKKALPLIDDIRRDARES